MIDVTIPLRTYSINHTEPLRRRMRRKKQERMAAALSIVAFKVPELPVVVTLTRVSPRDLDDDNLRGAMKHVRDGIADRLHVDDRDPRVTWLYAQARGDFAVRVGISTDVRRAPNPLHGLARPEAGAPQPASRSGATSGEGEGPR